MSKRYKELERHVRDTETLLAILQQQGCEFKAFDCFVNGGEKMNKREIGCRLLHNFACDAINQYIECLNNKTRRVHVLKGLQRR